MSDKNPEMRETAARICRDYLNGVWKHVTAQNIILKRIRFVRFLYKRFYVKFTTIYITQVVDKN